MRTWSGNLKTTGYLSEMSLSPEKLFHGMVCDMVRICQRDCTSVFSDFLDEGQCSVAEKILKSEFPDVMYSFQGGFPKASRKMLAVFPDYCEDYISEDFVERCRCVTFTYRKSDNLTHRDFLGTLMGMRLRRETVGDIVVSEGKTQIFMTATVAGLVISTVGKIGRVGVKVTGDEPFSLEVKQEFKTINGTVSSLRLDSIVSLATGLSREKSSALVKSERVDVNHMTQKSVSHILSAGDTVSVRGYGRFLLADTDGVTKKGRIRVTVKKFI